MFRWIRNKWRRFKNKHVYEFPDRITAMTQYRDLLVIATNEGDIYIAQWDEQIAGLTFRKEMRL